MTLTFSCAEYNSADISDALKLANSLPIDSNPNIPQLCCEDPITVTRQIDSKFQAFFLEVILKGECLRKVSNYYFKKEYQARGAPHYHVLLWIEGAPVIGIDPPEDVLSFIQNIITCNIPDKETDPELHHLVTTFQMHKCSGYCLRSRRVSAEKGGTLLSKGASSTSPEHRAM